MSTTKTEQDQDNVYLIPPDDDKKGAEDNVQEEPKAKQKKKVRFQESHDINELLDQMGHVTEKIIRRTMNHLGIGVASN